MAQLGRPGLLPEQKRELWARWKAGESLSEIGRAGSANTHIATLVERRTRYLLLVRVAGKDTATVVDAITAQVQTLPAQLRASLTWDRGMELADHLRFTIATDVAVYFCDPGSPWQRGSNENTNGLLRQYFPKKTNLSGYS